MKMKIFSVVIVVFLVAGAGFYFMWRNKMTTQSSNALWSNYTVIKKNIKGRELRLIVSSTPEQHEKGLMFVRKPVKDFDGMIFLFETKGVKTFWNMNTFEDLTLYWLNDEEVVGTSELPSIEKSKEIVYVSSSKPVNTVVELIK